MLGKYSDASLKGRQLNDGTRYTYDEGSVRPDGWVVTATWPEGLGLNIGRTCPEGICRERVTALQQLGRSSLVDLASVTSGLDKLVVFGVSECQ